MAIQAAQPNAALPAGYVPLLPRCPFSGDAQKIVPFLDDLTTLITARVSRAWNQNAQLKLARTNAREDAACLQEGFHEEIVKAFRSRQISLWRLPVVNMAGKPYEDYLTLQRQDLPLRPEGGERRYALARFKEVHDQRVGLLFDLQGYADFTLEQTFDNFRYSTPVRDIKGVISVFQRHPDRKRLYNWVADCEPLANKMGTVYRKQHEPNHEAAAFATCPTCPPYLEGSYRNGYINFVKDIVTNSDPAFRLADEIRVVDNPPQIPTLLRRVKRETAAPEPFDSPTSSLWSYLSAACSCLWQSISALFEAALSGIRASLGL